MDKFIQRTVDNVLTRKLNAIANQGKNMWSSDRIDVEVLIRQEIIKQVNAKINDSLQISFNGNKIEIAGK